MGAMRVQGVLGFVEFDGEWITITKKEPGKRKQEFRLRAADITGTRLKPGTGWFSGYLQFLLPGSLPAGETKGLLFGGRPPQSDPHSLSIRRKHNAAAEKLIAAVEQARRLSQ